MRTLIPTFALPLLLLAAPALAAPVDWRCTAAVRTWCDAGQDCGRAEVTPFVLILQGSTGNAEYCEGEHCERGVFQRADGPRDADRDLAFGWATLEPSPPPVGYVGRVYAVSIDSESGSVDLARAVSGSIEVIQATACTPDE